MPHLFVSLTETHLGCHDGRGQLVLILGQPRWFAWAALIASLAALTLTATAIAQQRGGTLIAAFSADPADFDPVRGPSGMSHVVIEQVYSTLMLLDPDAEPIPGAWPSPTRCPRTALPTLRYQ